VEVVAPAGGRLEVSGDDGPVLAVDVGTGHASLSVPGQDPVRVAVAPGAEPAVRLLVDAGLVEVATSAGEYAALRLPGTGSLRLTVPAGSDDVRVTAHAMPVAADRS
jgi:NAD(P)H-flavin reductase